MGFRNTTSSAKKVRLVAVEHDEGNSHYFWEIEEGATNEEIQEGMRQELIAAGEATLVDRLLARIARLWPAGF